MPLEVEAEQYFHGKHIQGVINRVKDVLGFKYPYAVIESYYGIVEVKEGDWIVTGIDGEPYPLKEDIFKQTYEAI